MSQDSKSSLLKTVKTALDRRIDKIKEDTKNQVMEINKRVEAERDKIIKNRLIALDNEMQIERARTLGAVHKEVQEAILQTKHQLIQKIESRVQQRIATLTTDDQIRFQSYLIEESLAYFGENDTDLRIIVDPKFVSVLKSVLDKKKLSVVIEEREIGLGVVVESPKRGFVIYNTLTDRLNRAREGFLESMEKILEVPA